MKRFIQGIHSRFKTIKVVTDNDISYVIDKQGNKAHFWSGRNIDIAILMLRSLRNCVECVDCCNCVDCIGCVDCINCEQCVQCNRCLRCVKCHNCTKSISEYEFY